MNKQFLRLPVRARRQVLIGAVTLMLVTLAVLLPWSPAAASPAVRHISLTAHSFEFTPGIVQVNRGDTVVLTVQSDDVVHGIYVDGYGVRAEAEPGQPAEVRFVANLPGAFRFRCSVACGNLHPFMIGKLIVGPNLTWLRAVLATLATAVGVVLAFWPARRWGESPA